MNSLNAPELLSKQHQFFASNKTRDLKFRMEQLNRLKLAIRKNEDVILDALHADMRKPRFEAYSAELAICIDEIHHAIKHLKNWARPRRVSTPIAHFFSTSRIYSEPKGVALIISPWNYPFQLLIAPLVASMAAGNCAVLKPSELAPKTSEAITKMIRSTFDPEYIACIEGGVEATQALLKERFDHIFFTGGTAVGKVIMEAAAKHLTPVTLELGGKSPCIVDQDFPAELAARRITWGKFFNAGQTCVAPDYLLVHKSLKAPLIEKMREVMTEFYTNDPSQTPNYARIVNDRHFARLTGLLSKGKLLLGGQSKPEERYLAPTVIGDVGLQDPIMKEEIFGPILPVLEFDRFEEALNIIAKNPKPLALYLFTKNSEHEKRVLNEVPFGGGCINDTLIHLSSTNLPFGGIGPSGMGAYHGRAGFDLFSHQKSVLKKTWWFDIKVRYAPYTAFKLSLVKKLIG